MPWNSQTGVKAREAQARAWAFLVLVGFHIFYLWILATPAAIGETSRTVALAEELSEEEKTQMIENLLAEGDRYLEEKNYNLANASYESIFLIHPNDLKASERIDRLKKRMLKEGRSETELVARVYDAEIELRVSQYLEQAKQLIAQGKLRQARFTLQKLLLIQPLHEEASKLYKSLDEKVQV